MARFAFKKLVRDKILDLCKVESIEAKYKYLDKSEHAKALKLKLIEEAEEVSQTNNTAELTEELADILELVESFKKLHSISNDDIEQARVAKHNKKGGFDTGLYIDYVDVDTNSSFAEYYRSEAARYPEIKVGDEE